MDLESGNKVRLGIFIIAGLILFISGMYFIGDNRNLFGNNIKLYTSFDNVEGLQKGNNVRYSGIIVGTVEEVKIQGDSGILVSMVLDKSAAAYIRKNSTASIGTDGLIGNRLINISPGTSEAGFIQEGDMISSHTLVNTDQMLSTLSVTNENISRVSEDLKKISGELKGGQGTVISLLSDTTSGSNIINTLKNLEIISANLRQASSAINQLSSGIQKGEGLLGSMSKDSSELHITFLKTMNSINETSVNLQETSQLLRGTIAQLEKEDNIASVLLRDSVSAIHLKNSLANIDSSAAGINELTKALEDNFLFRKYFKKSKTTK